MTGRMATDEKVLLEKAVSTRGGASLRCTAAPRAAFGPPASLARTTPRGLSGIGCTKAKQANAMIVTTVAQLLTKLLLISTRFSLQRRRQSRAGNSLPEIFRSRAVLPQGAEMRDQYRCYMLFGYVKTPILALVLVFLPLMAFAPANAQDSGPNLSLPDSSVVMPLVVQENYTTFFLISNVGESDGSRLEPEPVEVNWEFFDASGELIASVSRYVLGEGGTDVVDPNAVRSKDEDGTLGPPVSLAGRNGFVVVSAEDDEPRLIGNFTVANIATSAAWGASGIGLGANGLLLPGDSAVGSTFKINDLEDNLLVVIGIDDFGFVPTSLTEGLAPEDGEEILGLQISLQSNATFDPSRDEAVRELSASALFTTIEELFPETNPGLSGTLVVRPTDPSVTLVAFYGQAVGPFGAGQTFRMVISE